MKLRFSRTCAIVATMLATASVARTGLADSLVLPQENNRKGWPA